MKNAFRGIVGLGALTAIALTGLSGSASPALAARSAPAITITLNPTTLDYHNQTITVSGAVTPATSGTSVTVSYTNASNQPASVTTSTDASGDYQAAITGLVTSPQTITASSGGASASAQLGFTTDPVVITADFANPDVNADTSDVLSGVASYASGDTTYPLADATLSITSPGNLPAAPPVNATVTTAADGSYSYTAAGSDAPFLNFTVTSAATPYLRAGHVVVSMGINQLTSIDVFTGSLTPHHQLNFDACAGTGGPIEGGPLSGRLYYQYSKKPNGPWKTLGAATEAPYFNAKCTVDQDGDGKYLGHFKAPLASGYYRAYAPVWIGQMSSVSKVIHLARAATRITGFAVIPGRVGRAGKVTASGRLWVRQKKWTPDARQMVTIEYVSNGKTYVLSGRVRTNAAGRFTTTFRVPRTASWFVVYGGGRHGFATLTKGIKVVVR